MAKSSKLSGAAQRAAQLRTKQQAEKNRVRRENAFATVAAACAVLIFCLPVVVTNGYYNITDTKAWAFWVVMMLAVASMAAVWLAFKSGKNRVPLDIPAFARSVSPQEWAALAFIFIAFLSCCLSKYQTVVWMGADSRLDGFVTNLGYIALFFIIARHYRPRRWHINVLGGVCLGSFLLAVLQFRGVNVFGLYPAGMGLHNTNFLTLLGNINVVSSFSSMMAVFFGLLFIRSGQKLRWLYLGVSLAMFYTQTLAASDSGWVSIAAGILASLPFILTGKRTVLSLGILMGSFGLMGYLSHIINNANIAYSPTLGKYWLVVAAAGAVVALLALLLGNRVKLRRKIAFLLSCILVGCIVAGGFLGIELLGAKRTEGLVYQAREMLHGNMEDSFMTNRGYIWRTTSALIPGSPIIGYGLDSVNDAHIDAFGEDAVEKTGKYVGKAHNEYLQYILTVGVLGLAAYLALVVLALVRWGKRAYEPQSAPERFAAGGSAAGYVVQAVFNFSAVISAPYYWLFLAMAGGREERGEGRF